MSITIRHTQTNRQTRKHQVLASDNQIGRIQCKESVEGPGGRGQVFEIPDLGALGREAGRRNFDPRQTLGPNVQMKDVSKQRSGRAPPSKNLKLSFPFFLFPPLQGLAWPSPLEWEKKKKQRRSGGRIWWKVLVEGFTGRAWWKDSVEAFHGTSYVKETKSTEGACNHLGNLSPCLFLSSCSLFGNALQRPSTLF